jgi:branched-chain amino acid transport system substrate-binding protein
MRRNTILRAVPAGAAALLANACGAAPSPGKPEAGAPPAGTKAPGELRVGVNLELSGPAAVWGQAQLNALTMLAETLNAGGGVGGRPLKLIPYDNESNEAKSLVVTRRLIEADGVVAVVGAGTTPTTMPIVPLANETGTPVVSIGSANAIVEPVEERTWVFKTPSNTRDVVARLLAHLGGARLGRVGFLSVNSAYGDAGRTEMEAAAGGAGVAVTGWEKFGATDSDMKPQLARLRATDPQAVVIWATPPAASIIDRNHKELGLTVPLVHDHGASNLAYQELAGAAAEGSTVVAAKCMVADQLPDGDPVKVTATAYLRRFRTRHGRPAGNNDAMAYDALLLIARAAERSGADRAGLREGLEGLRDVVGTTGVFSLSPRDHNGLSVEDLVVARIQGGSWTLLQ